MAVIIEVKDPNSKGIHRYSLNHSEISLGRGYHNDVIIDDPYSDIHHATIKCNEAGFLIEDHSNLNGIQNNKRQRLDEISQILSGDHITIGHTQIRVLDSEHPLPETLALSETNSFIARRLATLDNLWLGMCLIAITWLLELDRIYLNTDREKDFTQYINDSIVEILGLLLIAGVLSFIGKVAVKEWRFLRNCSGLCLIFILVWALEIPLGWITFSISIAENLWLVDLALIALTVGLLAIVFITNLPRFKPLYTSIVFCVVTSATMTYLVVAEQENNERKKYYYPVISEVFTPIKLPFAKGTSEQGFLEESQIVFTKLAPKASEPQESNEL